MKILNTFRNCEYLDCPPDECSQQKALLMHATSSIVHPLANNGRFLCGRALGPIIVICPWKSKSTAFLSVSNVRMQSWIDLPWGENHCTENRHRMCQLHQRSRSFLWWIHWTLMIASLWLVLQMDILQTSSMMSLEIGNGCEFESPKWFLISFTIKTHAKQMKSFNMTDSNLCSFVFSFSFWKSIHSLKETYANKPCLRTSCFDCIWGMHGMLQSMSYAMASGSNQSINRRQSMQQTSMRTFWRHHASYRGMKY